MPSKTTKRKPLEEFAKGTRKLVAGNWITQIPEWPEVLAAWQSGISATTIHRWLIDECGYDPQECTAPRVAYINKSHPRSRRG